MTVCFFRFKLEHLCVLVIGFKQEHVMERESISEVRLRHQLDVQSRHVNRIFSQHRIPATISGGEVQPGVVSFDLQSQIAVGLDRIKGLGDELKTTLGVGAAALAQESGRWRLRIARPPEPALSLPQLLSSLDELTPMTAAIGMADGGQPVLLRFAPNQVRHVLVAGDAGAGKSSLLRTIGTSLAVKNRQANFQLVVMDPLGGQSQDGDSLLPLAYLPHLLTDPALNVESCVSLLGFLGDELDYRRKEKIRHPNIIILIDHLVSLLVQDRTCLQDIVNILQFGPQTGLHLVMATNRPDSRLLDTSFRSNLSLRFVGKLDQSNQAKRVAGINASQAHFLYGGGDFLAITSQDSNYFQAAYTGNYDLHMLLTDIYQTDRPRLLAQPYSPRLRLDDNLETNGKSKNRPFSIRNGSVAFENDGENETPLETDQSQSNPVNSGGRQ
ncbi:MAG: FtsK/SpoIIIE domain-containing protein [Chloroflexota bacterium]